MLLELDFQSAVPIYTQLRNQIIAGIASGQLKPGDPLPSVRNLAADLGINLHTVNKTYTILKQEGYIQIHRQKGVVINPEGMPKADQEFLERLREDLKPLIAEAICRQMEEEEFLKLSSEVLKAIYNQRGQLQ